MVLFLAIGSPALADGYCDDLWYTRNDVFDQAGFCFGSTLGKAVFDNGDCTTQTISLGPNAKKFVDYVTNLEAQAGCAVDTNRSAINLADLAIRRRLTDQPIMDELGSGCLGWVGPVVPLYAGQKTSSATIGQIDPGDFVSFGYLSVGDWSYVTTWSHNWGSLRSGGWLLNNIGDGACQDWAG